MSLAKRPWGAAILGALVVLGAAAALYTWRAGAGGEESGKPVANMATSPVVEARAIPHPLVGQPAPDLNLPGLDGKKVNLAGLKGKKVMAVFWTTW